MTGVHSTIIIPRALLAGRLEAIDTSVEHGVETVDVGPFTRAGHYYRVAAGDLVAAVDAARRLLDDIEASVLDARQDQIDADRHLCPYCQTRIDGDMEYCGSGVCTRRMEAERRYDAMGLI